jgi:hypothetical protein
MNTVRITTNDTLRPLLARITDSNGQPIDIEGDTITFRMTARATGIVKINNAAAANKQVGTGRVAISAITQAFPPVITTATHGLTTGDRVRIDGHNMIGMHQLADREFVVTVLSSTTFSLQDEDARNYEAYSSGGLVDTTGFVSYTWASADVDTAGYYDAQFIRTNTLKTEHAPTGKQLRIEIVAEV